MTVSTQYIILYVLTGLMVSMIASLPVLYHLERKKVSIQELRGLSPEIKMWLATYVPEGDPIIQKDLFNANSRIENIKKNKKHSEFIRAQRLALGVN